MLATCFIQPIDYLKVQIQLADKAGGAKAVQNDIMKGGLSGVTKMYSGLSAALLRQATYTTSRLGLFRIFCDSLKEPGQPLSPFRSAISSLAAGGLGSLIGNPADLALIRMQGDQRLPIDQRRNYKNVTDALLRIKREEGITGWWTGCGPTVVRAMALNLGMLATYDQSRQSLEASLGKGETTNMIAKLLSGFFASAFSLPFDFIKTQLQQQRPDAVTGQLKYKGVIDCAMKIGATDGYLSFYRGFGTFYARIAPHILLTFTFVEQMDSFLDKNYWKDA